MSDPSNLYLALHSGVAKSASESVSGLENKCKAAMRATITNDWMCSGDDACFRGAIGGVLLDVGKESDDGKRLMDSYDLLRKFCAFLHAAQAGVNAEVPVGPEDVQPLPLMSWFREAKQAERRT